jgi:transcriptional regulator with XRE-family HTH domain
MTNEELLELGLGERLRRIREDRGLAVSQLAARSGVAEDQLQAIESNQEAPAVGDLVKIAAVLDVSLGHFFQRAITDSRIEVVRSQNRWTVQPQSEAARSLNYRYQSLSYNLTDKLMAPFLIEIPPSPSEDVPSSSHDGEEFLFVLSGHLEVTVGDEVNRLEPGDSIYFDSRVPHTLRAVEGTLARVLACIAQQRRSGLEDPIRRAF